MADFHRYKFYYAGNKEYSDGYDRIFKKEGKNEVDSKGDKTPRRIHRQGKTGRNERAEVRKKGSKKGLSRLHQNQETGGPRQDSRSYAET